MTAPPPATTPATATRATAPPATATNAEIVRWAFGVLNTRDVAPLRGLWTAQTIERFPTGTCVGTESIAAYFEETFAALPDFHLEIVQVLERGEDVMIRWHLTGTHAGAPWQGVAASGRAVALDGVDHFVLREGKVVSNFVVFDQLQFARQVGLLPADRTPADRVAKLAFAARQWLRTRRRRG